MNPLRETSLQDWQVSTPGKIVLRLSAVVGLTMGILTLIEGLWLVNCDVPDFRGAEQNVTFSIQKFMATGQLYTDPSNPPFDVKQYPPAYYLATAGLCRVVGVQPHDAEGVTGVARSFSLLCAVLMLGLMYQLMRRDFQVPRVMSLVACAYVVSLTAPWYFLARPDSLMALLLLAAISCGVKSVGSGRAALVWVATAAVFALLATAAKQNGLQALAVLFLFLATTRRFARLSVMAGVFAMAALLAVLASYHFLGGHVKEHVVDGIDNGLCVYVAVLKCYSIFFPSHAFPLAILLIAITSWLGVDRLKESKRLLLTICVLFFLLFATLTSLKIGSAINYYNEFIVLATITVAAYLAGEERRPRSSPGPSLVVSLMAAYLLFFLPYWTTHHFYFYCYQYSERFTLVPALAKQFRAYDEMARWLDSRLNQTGQPSYVLSFVKGLDNLLLEDALAPQKELVGMAHERKLVNYERLRLLIRSGRVPFAAALEGELPEELAGARLDAYVPVARFDQCIVYQWRPQSSDTSYAADSAESNEGDHGR